MRCATLCLVLAGALARTRPSEYIARKKGAKTRGCLGECSAEPHLGEAPTQFTWAGHLTDDQPSMLTAVLNQHMYAPPQCTVCRYSASPTPQRGAQRLPPPPTPRRTPHPKERGLNP